MSGHSGESQFIRSTQSQNGSGKCQTVFKRIFILDQIKYRILFVLAKLTESNNEYYSCCEIYNKRYNQTKIKLS